MSESPLARILSMHDRSDGIKVIRTSSASGLASPVFESSDLQNLQSILDDVVDVLNVNGDVGLRSQLALEIIELAKTGSRDARAIKAKVLRHHGF